MLFSVIISFWIDGLRSSETIGRSGVCLLALGLSGGVIHGSPTSCNLQAGTLTFGFLRCDSPEVSPQSG